MTNTCIVFAQVQFETFILTRSQVLRNTVQEWKLLFLFFKSDEEEPDELQEAKKNTMMNEDIDEKEKPMEETRVCCVVNL